MKHGARVQHRHTRRFGTVYRAAGPDRPHACVLFDGDRFTLPVLPTALDYVRGTALDGLFEDRKAS